MPTDRLTIRSTTRASSVNENSAAAEMLTMPANVVASSMEMSTGSILGPLVGGTGAPDVGQDRTRKPDILPSGSLFCSNRWIDRWGISPRRAV
jgi:hypothetical protein